MGPRWTLALALAILTAPPARAASAPARIGHLGGWIAVSDSLDRCWPVATSFRFPVGDPDDFSRPAGSGKHGYMLLRGVSAGSDTSAPHQGADLGRGLGGDLVRAASDGLVVRGRGDDWQAGYGYYVTLAHRLPDGSLVYTVYAHLAPGSVRRRAGAWVAAGEALGRVGRSGRASTAHLHFEVRRPSDPSARWEKAAVEDPIAFVRERLDASPLKDQGLALDLERVGPPEPPSRPSSIRDHAPPSAPAEAHREHAQTGSPHPPVRKTPPSR